MSPFYEEQFGCNVEKRYAYFDFKQNYSTYLGVAKVEKLLLRRASLIF